MNKNSKSNMVKKEKFSVKFKKDFQKNKFLYFMFLPVLAYFILFHYIPMYGILIAFQDYSPRLGVFGSKWVGLENFIKFFSSPSFFLVLRNTVKISFSSLLFGFPAPIILALLLNEVKSARVGRLVQNVTYLPHFVSMVVVCGIIHIFTKDTGVIGSLYNSITGAKGSMLDKPDMFLPIYILSNIWKEMGWGSIIYLSALLAIDDSLYEAAEIDGANRWRQTLHVTIPAILPTIIIMLILRLGKVLGVGYEKILLLYNSSTMDVADVISTYVYRRGLIDQDWSYSSAVGLFNTVVNLMFVGASNYLSRKVNGYALW